MQLSKRALKTKADLLFWTVISYHRSLFWRHNYLNMWLLILTMLINSTFACLAIPAFTQRLKVPAQTCTAMENIEHSVFSRDNTSKKRHICLISEFRFDDMPQNSLDHGYQQHVPIHLSKVSLILILISMIKDSSN